MRDGQPFPEELRHTIEQRRQDYIERQRTREQRRLTSTRLTESQRETLQKVKASEPVAYVPSGQLERERLGRLRHRELVLSVQYGRRLAWRLTQKGRALLDADG